MTDIDWPNYELDRKLSTGALVALVAVVLWGIFGFPGVT